MIDTDLSEVFVMVEVRAPEGSPTGGTFLLREKEFLGSGIATRISMPCTELLTTRLMDKVLTAEDDDHGIPADPRDEVLIWGYVRLMLGNQVELMRTPKGLGRFHGSRASLRRTTGRGAMGSPGTSAAACKT